MKKMRRKLLTVLFFVIFILMDSISLATFQSARVEELDKEERIQEMIIQTVELSQEEQEILDLANEYREQNGLEALKPLARLQQTAKIKAKDLVENEYFSHHSKQLGTPFEMLKANQVVYDIAGENLAGNMTPKKAVESWINSKTHRENILEGRFNYTGVSAIESPIYGKVFVQLFIGIEE